MATNTPITHVYNEINIGKYKSVKHYELIEVKNGTTQLSNLINISKDRNCAQSMPTYWLKIRQGNKWSRCITGLFKTSCPGVYNGDLQKKKHLIIFQFKDDINKLIVYVFNGYFTSEIRGIIKLLNL